MSRKGLAPEDSPDEPSLIKYAAMYVHGRNAAEVMDVIFYCRWSARISTYAKSIEQRVIPFRRTCSLLRASSSPRNGKPNAVLLHARRVSTLRATAWWSHAALPKSPVPTACDPPANRPTSAPAVLPRRRNSVAIPGSAAVVRLLFAAKERAGGFRTVGIRAAAATRSSHTPPPFLPRSHRLRNRAECVRQCAAANPAPDLPDS